METLIITGGCGFIGSNLVRMILSETPYHIINIDALTYAGKPENLWDIENNPRYTFLHERIENTERILDFLKGKQDIVGIINCAAESHVDRSIESAFPFVTTNVLGTLSMLEVHMKIGSKRFLQVSTDEVYGSLGEEGFFIETTPLAPNSPYSASKASADLIVRSYVKTHGIDAVITRCSNNYGPYQDAEKLIPKVLTRALTHSKIPIYGDGKNVRDWIYVTDHCQGILKAFIYGKKGEIYNFGGNTEMTNIDIVSTILEAIGGSWDLVEFVKDRAGHDRRYAIDSSKSLKELGWSPLVDFSNGIKKTIDWYQVNL